MQFLIFDFDGVLGDTLEPLVKVNARVDGTDESTARNKLLSYYDKKTPHGKEKSPQDVEKWAKFYETLGIELHQNGYNLFDDFIKEISKISNAKLAIVSSANTIFAKQVLKQTHLDFTHILGFQDHHSKEEKVKIIAKDWGVDMNELYYFTDTKTDFWELENILDKTKIIGCAWGWQGFDKLNEVLPENQILKEFSDIHLVIEPKESDLIEKSIYLENLKNWCQRDSRGIVVSGCLLNGDKKVLIQRRSPNRRLYPDFWELSFGGHLVDNESIFEAIQREMLEETNLSLDKINGLIQIYDWEVPDSSRKDSDNHLKREFVFVVTTKSNLSELKIEDGKVTEQKWINLEELEELNKSDKMDEYIYKLLKKVLINNSL